MPDIILNTRFNNPSLPKVPVYGFFDDFNRPDAAVLGTTSGEDKPWSINGPASWRIIGGAAEITALGSGGAGGSFPTVDALRSNGTLTSTITQIGTAAGGLVARYVDGSNYLRVNFRQSSGVNRIQFQQRVNGTLTLLGTSAADKVTANGSAVGIVLDGTTATVTLDGVTVIGPVTVPASSSTHHGLYGADAAAGIRYGDIRFVPAS